MSGRPRRATIRDVARASGTSITTVSVALSGGPGVAEATRARIIEVGNRLGWRPNRRASALRRTDPRLVGLVYEVEQDFQAMLVDAVVSDDRQALSQAVTHLTGLGHRAIAHVDGGDVSTLSARRRQAYEAAMANEGLGDLRRVVRGGSTLAAGVGAAHALAALDPLPTAVVCYNDSVAAGVARTLRQLGVAVPGDVSVVGFDDGPVAADPTTDLTTIVQDRDLIATTAMGLLARRIADAGVVAPGDERVEVIPTRLTVRSSTGPARETRPS